MIKHRSIGSVSIVILCALLLIVTSCARKQVQVEQETSPPAPDTSLKVTPPPEPPKDTGPTAAEMQARADQERQQRELEARNRIRMEIREFESENIYFDFDKSELKPDARDLLVKKAEWLRQNQEFSVLIEGHCDDRGTNEYNLALGERRSNAAWKFLNALGISGDRISTISYGEERPADPGHNSEAWARNRRDEFKLIR